MAEKDHQAGHTDSVQKIINATTGFFDDFDEFPGGERLTGDNYFGIISNVKHPMLNSILETQLDQHTVTPTIQDVISFFREKQLPFIWFVFPTSTPTDLAEHLLVNGLEHSQDMPGMLVKLDDLHEEIPVLEKVRIERVDNTAAFKDWMNPFKSGYELPEIVNHFFFSYFQSVGFTEDGIYQHFVAYLEDVPVACGTASLGADGVAGIWNIATAPEARGKGIGTAITWRACDYARHAGYLDAMLLSSTMGYKIYQKLGFKEYCKIQSYHWMPLEDE